MPARTIILLKAKDSVADPVPRSDDWLAQKIVFVKFKKIIKQCYMGTCFCIKLSKCWLTFLIGLSREKP